MILIAFYLDIQLLNANILSLLRLNLRLAQWIDLDIIRFLYVPSLLNLVVHLL